MRGGVLSLALLLVVVAGCTRSEPVAPASPSPARGQEAAGAASVPPARPDGRLPGGVRPVGYRLALKLDPSAAEFTGRAEIALEVKEPADAIVLHGREIAIRTAHVEQGGRKLVARSVSGRPAAGSRVDEELVVTFGERLELGPAALVIEYASSYGSGLRGLYRFEGKDGSRYLFTQLQPTDARRVFPCFDEPEHKVPFSVEVQVPAGNLVIGNMPEAVRDEQDGWVRFAFEESPPMSTYLVALAVGPLEVREGPTTPAPIRLVTTRGRGGEGDLALGTAAEQLAILEGYFGSPYPYPKLDLVAVPDFAAGAMENPGLVTFREERLLVPEDAAPGARRAMAATVAHELSHMWFGNLVTMRWWDDIWLNEGFASWMTNHVLDEWRPGFAAAESAMAHKSHAMRLDTLSTARAVRQPVRSTTEAIEAFDGITYAKGMSLLEMVEAWVGPDVFRDGIRRYIEAHRWGSATSRDLFAAIGQASGRDATAVLETFTTQVGVPVVRAEWGCEGTGTERTLKVRLRQEELRPLGTAEPEAPRRWAIPACVRFEHADGVSERVCTLLDGSGAEMARPVERCPDWLIANAGHAGYYHSALDPESLALLRRTRGAGLLPRELAGVLVDAWALVTSGDLELTEYLELAAALAPGRRRAVWGQVLHALERIATDLVDGEDRPAFSRFVRGLVGKEAAALGWEAAAGEPEDPTLRRQALLRALGTLGEDAATRAEARRITERWVRDPGSVDAAMAEVAVLVAGSAADRRMVQALADVAARARNAGARVLALRGLGAIRDPELLDEVLAGALDGSIRAQDLRYVLVPLASRRETRSAASAWLEAHWDALAGDIPPFLLRGLVHALARSCDDERRESVRAFLEPRLARVEGGERTLAQSLEAGRRCSAFRARHREALRVFLAGR